jgi:hypothetical protein
LIFNHAFDGPDLYGAFDLLGDNALKPEVADGSKHLVTVALGVFDVLNAITRAKQKLAGGYKRNWIELR